MKKHFCVIKHSDKWEDRLWVVHKRLSSMEQALQSLRGLTKSPKETRDYIYTIIPFNDPTRKYISIHPDHIEHVKQTAK
jgi:hypothetical protein